jgi:predicted peptidase
MSRRSIGTALPLIELLEPRVQMSAATLAHGGGALEAMTPTVLRAMRGGVSAPVTAPVRTDLSNSTVGAVTYRHKTIPYRIFVPTLASASDKVPLILYLHGYGDGGTDNITQTYWMSRLQANTSSGAYGAFVVAPQLPKNWAFGTTDRHQTDGLTLTLMALGKAMNNPNVDLSRIYVVGVSAGAYGAWDLIRRYPKLFAAAVPMSFAGDRSWAKVVANVPVWAFQGSADPVQSARRMRSFIAAVVAAHGKPQYTEIAGAGHYIWDSIFDDAGLYSWMFSHSRG